jgi:hypothetical protein
MKVKRAIDSPNFGQRIVLVIAWAGILRAAGSYVVGPSGPFADQWFAYAPNTQAAFVPPGLESFGSALVWMALTVVWAAVSVWLLKRGPRPPSVEGS